MGNFIKSNIGDGGKLDVQLWKEKGRFLVVTLSQYNNKIYKRRFNKYENALDYYDKVLEEF